MFLLQIPSIPIPTADTTKVSSFFEKLSHASNMGVQQFMEQMISGLIHGIIKILIAAIIFWIGRWLIKKIKYIVTNILERRHV